MNKEYIICAAIWYRELPTQHFLPVNITEGIVICGHRHGHCIDLLKTMCNLRTTKLGPDSVGTTVQGFLTNTNRFVSRKNALQIAKDANQLINPSYITGNELYSEDIY